MSASVDIEWWSLRKLKVFLAKYDVDITGIEHDKPKLVEKARILLEGSRGKNTASRGSRMSRRQHSSSKENLLSMEKGVGSSVSSSSSSSSSSSDPIYAHTHREDTVANRKSNGRASDTSFGSAAGSSTSGGWGHRYNAGRGKKIIFLDVDGVLNTHDRGRSLLGQRRPGMTPLEVIRADLHKQLLKRLAWVCRETGSEVVLSSAWRMLDDYRGELLKQMRAEGIRHIGDTLSLPLRLETQDGKCLKTHEKQRVVEILLWLQENGPVRSWVVVDDMDLWAAAGPMFSSHMVQTKPLFGFTKADADYMIRLLDSCGYQPQKASELPRPKLEVRAYGRVTGGLGSGAKNNNATGEGRARARSNSLPNSIGRCSILIPERFGIDPNVPLPPQLALQINAAGEAILQPRRRSFLGRLMGLN